MLNDLSVIRSEACESDPDESGINTENLLTENPILVRSDLVTILNHEVRTSINVIMGFAQILGFTDVNRDELDSYAETIRSESEHLLNIFNEFFSEQVLSSILLPSIDPAGIQKDI